LDENQIAAKDIVVDQAAEAKEIENKWQAQERAGIAQDPDPDLLAFVVPGQNKRVSI
jgi:hypothetical protein